MGVSRLTIAVCFLVVAVIALPNSDLKISSNDNSNSVTFDPPEAPEEVETSEYEKSSEEEPEKHGNQNGRAKPNKRNERGAEKRPAVADQLDEMPEELEKPQEEEPEIPDEPNREGKLEKSKKPDDANVDKQINSDEGKPQQLDLKEPVAGENEKRVSKDKGEATEEGDKGGQDKTDRKKQRKDKKTKENKGGKSKMNDIKDGKRKGKKRGE